VTTARPGPETKQLRKGGAGSAWRSVAISGCLFGLFCGLWVRSFFVVDRVGVDVWDVSVDLACDSGQTWIWVIVESGHRARRRPIYWRDRPCGWYHGSSLNDFAFAGFIVDHSYHAPTISAPTTTPPPPGPYTTSGQGTYPPRHAHSASRTYKVMIPVWALMVADLSWLVHALVVPPRRRRRLRLANGQCTRCGYDLRASTGRCPECGTAIPPAAPAADNATPASS
jgi:hypothetical protein